MNKVFLDTNVLLDFLLKRKTGQSDSYEKALAVINFCILTNIPIYFSILSIKDIFYILTRLMKSRQAKEKQLAIKQKVNGLLQLGEILVTSENAFLNAMGSSFADFEDALQNYTATEANVNIIVTRNKKDFINSEIRVYTPGEFLNLPIS